MRHLRLPLLEQASINRDMLRNCQLHTPRSVHISKRIFLCSRRCGSDTSKKEGHVCRRQSAPCLRCLTRSATNVARRALVTSISAPDGEDKSTQCAIFHKEVAPRVIKPQHIIWPLQRGENSHAAQVAGGRQPKVEVLTSNLQIVFPCATW